ncbi:MAG: COX15/CtaA family protein [Chitinophagaceae bacterium]
MNTLQEAGLTKSQKLVAYWLLTGVAMTVIQIALGGITRLTGSGLSITEWQVITGSLPPLSEQAWLLEFEKYQQTPQFKLLNFDFTLSEFKFIFFWEWFHRLWARLIGLVFLVGFVYFLLTKQFDKPMVKPLVVLFVLGALQGGIGWIMVASGLTGDAVYVKPTRLALHFIFALVLLSYTFWFALKLLVPAKAISFQPLIRKIIWLIVAILVIQLLYGALMAGHKAATAAATWPTINGFWLPDGLLRENPILINFIDNKILVHFIHRGLAYILTILIVWWWIKAKKTALTATAQLAINIPMLLVVLQVCLGIFTVLSSTQIIPGKWGIFEWMAQLHQLTGMLLLLAYVYVLYLIRD